MVIQSDVIHALFTKAQQHVVEHGCSAHPYQSAKKLSDLVIRYAPKLILEIGTGIGFTTLVMALSAPSAHISTIERNSEHVVAAERFFADQHTNITVIEGIAEVVLPQTTEQFDLIFFDAYGIHYEFLPQYHRLLNNGGVAVIANNHLVSKTSTRFFSELHDHAKWKIVDQFADTTVAIKI